MLIKTLPVTVKAEGDSGQFEAVVATYDVDDVGDKIIPGAFTKTLQDWQASGRKVPVIWSHQHADPFSHIGEAIDIHEVPDQGLLVKGQLDLDNPTAQQVYKLLKTRRVDNFSFAYDVIDGADAADDKGVQELRELKLFEVGPTLIGANQDTRTLTVKEARTLADLLPLQLKVGRVLSAKNEDDLRSAHEAIGRVLDQLSTDQGKSAPPTPPATSGPDESPDQEHRVDPAVLIAQLTIAELSTEERQ